MTASATRTARRRLALTTGIGLATALALGACGSDAESSSTESGDAEIVLNMVWWGHVERANDTEAALRIFEEKNPGIRVTTEYQDSGPYQDKLATRIAGGDAPDIMAMPNRRLREYADRGALADLTDYPEIIDLTDLTDNSLNLGTVEGSLYGVPAGLNTIGIIVRTSILDEYGVELPNDQTWSWEDFAAMAQEVSDQSDGEVYGTGYEVATETGPILWARQHGEDFYAEDGTIGVSAETMAAWWQMSVDLRESGAYPPAGFFEQLGSSAEQSYIAQGKVATTIFPTNNLRAYNEASGGDIAMLRMPGEVSNARRGHSIDASQLWSMSATSEHPEAAAELMDFLINDVDAYQELMTTRGAPPSTAVTEAILDSMPEDDQIATEFLQSLQAEELPPAYTYPLGAGEVATILDTLSAEVEFGRITPDEAGEMFVEQASAAVEN